MENIVTFPIENKEEIETLLKKHRFVGTTLRTNVAAKNEMTTIEKKRTGGAEEEN